ncbi:MAG: nucleotidyltransferase family protein [Sandarakinorhabdus sp.]|nr:nucleotidyltransferase family protein [Sandarakinorhabdus sp.]
MIAGEGHIVGALVLAAGSSRRMGVAKLALPIGGLPMIAATLAVVTAAGLPMLMVTGAHAKAVRSATPGVPSVHARDHALGLSESLKVGLAAAPADWDAVLVVLGDMPFVQPETLLALAAALKAGSAAVVPVEAGRRGNPAGFARAVWPALMALSGDQGARPLLDGLDGLGGAEVPVNDAGIHRDIDVPGDLP